MFFYIFVTGGVSEFVGRHLENLFWGLFFFIIIRTLAIQVVAGQIMGYSPADSKFEAVSHDEEFVLQKIHHHHCQLIKCVSFLVGKRMMNLTKCLRSWRIIKVRMMNGGKWPVGLNLRKLLKKVEIDGVNPMLEHCHSTVCLSLEVPYYEGLFFWTWMPPL